MRNTLTVKQWTTAPILLLRPPRGSPAALLLCYHIYIKFSLHFIFIVYHSISLFSITVTTESLASIETNATPLEIARLIPLPFEVH